MEMTMTAMDDDDDDDEDNNHFEYDDDDDGNDDDTTATATVTATATTTTMAMAMAMAMTVMMAMTLDVDDDDDCDEDLCLRAVIIYGPCIAMGFPQFILPKMQPELADSWSMLRTHISAGPLQCFLRALVIFTAKSLYGAFAYSVRTGRLFIYELCNRPLICTPRIPPVLYRPRGPRHRCTTCRVGSATGCDC